jgi:hypothetical protein
MGRFLYSKRQRNLRQVTERGRERESGGGRLKGERDRVMEGEM